MAVAVIMKLRLDKYLTEMGCGTRSQVKKEILKGSVSVNGEIAKKAERKVDTEKDEIIFKGEKIFYAGYEYFMLNKPAGVVSATEDKKERTVIDLIKESKRKDLFPAGRLDKDTEGLLLITNDGQLAHRLLSPKKHVDKTYFAVTEGKVVPEDIEKIREGVDIGDEELTLPGKLEILKTWEVQMPSASVKSTESEAKWRSEILLTIHEGRFHQVKRMMEALGKTVIYLKRMSMGPLVLPEDFPKGQCRELTKEELAALKEGR